MKHFQHFQDTGPQVAQKTVRVSPSCLFLWETGALGTLGEEFGGWGSLPITSYQVDSVDRSNCGERDMPPVRVPASRIHFLEVGGMGGQTSQTHPSSPSWINGTPVVTQFQTGICWALCREWNWTSSSRLCGSSACGSSLTQWEANWTPWCWPCWSHGGLPSTKCPGCLWWVLEVKKVGDPCPWVPVVLAFVQSAQVGI